MCPRNSDPRQTRFLYDGGNPVQELDAGGTPTANLVSGLGIDELFALIDGSGTHSVLTDALGSTIAAADGSGTLEAEYTYEPFGKGSQTGSGGSAYQFTGRENDGTGLQFSRARYYDPTLGRFIAEDPLGFGSGDPNLYAYVAGSPTNFTDPLGLDAIAVPTSPEVPGLTPASWGFAAGYAARKFFFSGNSGEGGTGDYGGGGFGGDGGNGGNGGDGGGGGNGGNGGTGSHGQGRENWPDPPGYDSGTWKWDTPTRAKEARRGDNLWDPAGGEWHWDEDPYGNHAEEFPDGHWDYNPHDAPYSQWQHRPPE